MKAKYLTVAGNAVNVGDTYFTVSRFYPFSLCENKAANENNTITCCYFKFKPEAEHYKKLLEMFELTLKQVRNINVDHCNK